MGKIISNGIEYSGMMNVEGVFIDTDNIIQTETTFTTSMSYTATKDCCVYILFCGNNTSSGFIKIGNKEVGKLSRNDSTGMYVGQYFYVKKGQTISAETPNVQGLSYIVYGIQSGSNVIGEIKKLDDFITLSSGYTLNANSLILKQGNFVFADIIIQKNSNFSTSQNVVGSVPSKYSLVKNVQTYGILSAQPYNKSNYNAYFLIDRNNNGQVEVWANDDGYPVVEVKFIAELS